jgi:uncharacterized protein YjbI with pentapeptide repeats
MANEEHLARLKEGGTPWNRWREKHGEITPDFSQADLHEHESRGVNLQEANLRGTDLRFADLRWSDLRSADFSEQADLHGADLRLADLRGAILHSANLSGANLSSANLSGADLDGVTLDYGHVGRTLLGDVDLSTVRGLDTVAHFGPSTIGIDTLCRSRGIIPEVFLRGAGVPDEMITYSKSLVGRPFEFYSCFISYSSQDQEFAERLHADLQGKGVRCWFAPHDVQGGRKLHEQIDQAIRVHERLLLILSLHSMQSEWVKTEIAKARQREVRENRRVLFPIRLASYDAIREWECFDADTGKDSAREIREYFIPDFSNWKNYDAYQEACRRLLRDLKPNVTLL